MTLDELFKAFYYQYRTEAVTPPSTDDEYVIFTGLANEAINRWANYDNTYWKELFDTAQNDGSADLTVTSDTEYAAPSNMREGGGFIRIFDSLGNTQRRIPIIEPQDAQFQPDIAKYAWFRGNPNDGYTLVLNPVPDTPIIGMEMDYVYYKIPNLLASGSDTPEMSQPYFIVHRALANRFRGSRNPYYNNAKSDAEDVLKTMQMDNNSGNWADPWKLADRSGSVWGTNIGSERGIW